MIGSGRSSSHKRQREEEEPHSFTRACTGRLEARRVQMDAVREECEAYAARLARAATRHMLHADAWSRAAPADAERVWGKDWQSR